MARFIRAVLKDSAKKYHRKCSVIEEHDPGTHHNQTIWLRIPVGESVINYFQQEIKDDFHLWVDWIEVSFDGSISVPSVRINIRDFSPSLGESKSVASSEKGLNGVSKDNELCEA